MENLIETGYVHLKGKLIIAPITTMSYSGFGSKTHIEIVKEDLLNIENLLNRGVFVLGWINQKSNPCYAIGGGITNLSPEISNLIQSELKRFSALYK